MPQPALCSTCSRTEPDRLLGRYVKVCLSAAGGLARRLPLSALAGIAIGNLAGRTNSRAGYEAFSLLFLMTKEGRGSTTRASSQRSSQDRSSLGGGKNSCLKWAG